MSAFGIRRGRVATRVLTWRRQLGGHGALIIDEVQQEFDNLLTKLESAEMRIALAKDALVATGYFTADEVGNDIAPRITELWSALDHPVTTCVEEGNRWEPTRWWRVIGADGSLWCETSDESEARDAVRTGDTLQRLWASVQPQQWRDAG